LVLVPVYTRFLSVSEYGIVELTRPIIAVWAVICAAGLPDATVRQRFDYRVLESARRFTGTVAIGSAIVAATLTSAVLVFGRPVSEMLIGLVPFEPYVRLSLMTGAGLALPLLLLAHFQAAGRPAFYALVQVLQGLLSVVLVTYFVAISSGGAEGQLLGRLSIAALMTFVAAVVLLRAGRIGVDTLMLRGAIVFGLPILVHSLLWLVLQYADRVILQHFVGLDEVGMYALGYNVALSVGTVVALYNRAWLPRLYDGLTSGAMTAADLARSTSRFVALALLVGLTIATYAPEVIGLLAPANYSPASDVLAVLALGNVFLALYQASTNLIWLRQKTVYSAGITAVTTVINILLNLVLVPRFGILGAAWATALSLGLYAGVATVISQRLHGISYERTRLLMLAIVGMGLYALAELPTFGGWEKVVWKAATCLTYGLAAWAITFQRPETP
jgi:O-antigen/teichoic acid export membrane protein